MTNATSTTCYRRYRLPLFGFLSIALMLIAGCASKQSTGYLESYEDAVAKSHSPSANQPKSEQQLAALFNNLYGVFADLKHPDLDQRIRQAYAPSVYFNDTFHIHSNRDDIITYLVDTARRVNQTTTEFHEFAQSGQSYFVRWTMHIDFDISGKNIKTDSIGISQIKFDDQGLIIFHQDFWDNTEGFFRHLPVVGYLLDKTLKKL